MPSAPLWGRAPRGALPVTGSRVLWSTGMMVYRLCLLGANGAIAAVRRFSAATDAEALSVARVMIKGQSRLSGFELWQGGHKVHAERLEREQKV